MTSAAVAPASPLDSTSSASVSVSSLLRDFLALQAQRAEAYAQLHAGFRTFMREREEFEQGEEEANEQRAKKSTVMVKSDAAAAAAPPAGSCAASTPPASAAGAAEVADSAQLSESERAALSAIASENAAAAAKPRVNPEHTFQALVQTVMRRFQELSGGVRALLPRLESQPAPGAHFASLLGRLQQLEKSKLECTVHRQMLANHHYVLRHPRAHGQLREHHHHSARTETDSKGRIIQKKKKKSAAAAGKLEQVGEGDEQEEEQKEEHGEHDEHEHEHDHADDEEAEARARDEQELADNRHPYTRHLSALLSDTAFQRDSPFLFDPSGAAPPPLHLDPLPSATAESHPGVSEAAEAAYQSQVSELRAQESGVIEAINEILEEVRMETMDDEADDE